MGAAVGMLAWAASDWFDSLLDFIESDVDDKLRQMRVQTPYLRYYLASWLYFNHSVQPVQNGKPRNQQANGDPDDFCDPK